MKFDLTTYSFENHQHRLLLTASAGKGAARGREEDNLLLKLWPSEAISLSDAVLDQALAKLALAFFKTSGSVTNAMRGLADSLNKTFLSGNSQLQEKDTWQTTSLLIGVIHHETLFVGINGKAEALLIRKDGREHLFDTELDPRGLGLSSVVHPRFFQTAVTDGDFVLLAQEIPANLLASDRLSPDTTILGEFVPFLGGTDVIRLTYGEGLSLKARLDPKPAQVVQEVHEMFVRLGEHPTKKEYREGTYKLRKLQQLKISIEDEAYQYLQKAS